MTEAMTFNALRRIPFPEIKRLIILNNEQTISNKDLLKKHGWTIYTYHKEWLSFNKG